jgi:hypothetical protein
LDAEILFLDASDEESGSGLGQAYAEPAVSSHIASHSRSDLRGFAGPATSSHAALSQSIPEVSPRSLGSVDTLPSSPSESDLDLDITDETQRRQFEEWLAANCRRIESLRLQFPFGLDAQPRLSSQEQGHQAASPQVCTCPASTSTTDQATSTLVQYSNENICTYCRLPCGGEKTWNKLRPCKGKRERYKKLIDKIHRLIEEDPENFDLGSVRLPQFVACNAAIKAKIMSNVTRSTRIIKARREQAVL